VVDSVAAAVVAATWKDAFLARNLQTQTQTQTQTQAQVVKVARGLAVMDRVDQRGRLRTDHSKEKKGKQQ
jgi:hypothetical protein